MPDPVDETVALDTWLTARLGGDSALRDLVSGVYRSLAPQGAVMPYVIFSVQAGDDMTSLCGSIGAGALVQVKAVFDERVESQIANGEAAVSRLRALLMGARGEGSGYRFVVSPAGPISYLETAAGTKHYRHQGRLWRIRLMGD